MSAASFYAVARGRSTGVFRSWAEAERPPPRYPAPEGLPRPPGLAAEAAGCGLSAAALAGRVLLGRSASHCFRSSSSHRLPSAPS